MDGRVEGLAIQNTQGHFTYLLLIMPQQFITQTRPLDAIRNQMSPKNISRATPGPGEAASWERTTTASSYI